MKALVLYKSKYGATKKYAEEIANALNADICDIDRFKISQVHNYDSVIIGGGMYVGSIACFKFIKKYTLALSSKNLFVFAVGVAPAERKVVNDLRIKYFSRAIERVPLFYFRGSIDKTVLNFKDKMLYDMVAKSIKGKDVNEYDPMEKAIAEIEANGESAYSWIDPDSIRDLVDAVKEGRKAENNY